MNNLSEDPIINGINNQIFESIKLCCKERLYSAAVILIFSGIDAMSHLNRDTNKDYNDAKDFKSWIQRYFYIEGETEISPDEWWAAQNAITHTFGSISRMHEREDVRELIWMAESVPHIRFNPKVSPNLVIVDIHAMRDAFIEGTNKFLVDAFTDQGCRDLLEERLNRILVLYPHTKQNDKE